MTKEEFKNAKLGDIVTVTTNGKNRGKTGIVREIGTRSFSGVFLEPLNCEFDLPPCSNRANYKEGLYFWRHEHVRNLVKESKKNFYVAVMYGEEGVSWPTTSFNTKELTVIDRFLKELNDHAEALTIDAIAIIDAD